eukprot:GHVS01000566.1.p1 GENE.GHVS01000566.1~~GHVS01000566.1.p1  ORF type:complete len:613 (+),score=101.49 GHVS01000566.1:151-1839(+)
MSSSSSPDSSGSLAFGGMSKATHSSHEQAAYKAKLRSSLKYTLGESLVPELGMVKKGKVRDIYLTEKYVYMIASDRVSAFDCMLSNLIPYKGEILNRISSWAFEQTKDIVPNALILSSTDTTQKTPPGTPTEVAADYLIDPNVLVQRRLKPLMVECIVRGYLWGSMAVSYEKGEREICGQKVPYGLLRYQKLAEPLFTPTTKAPDGEHDSNITMGEMSLILKEDGGGQLAEKLKGFSLKLYERGSALARQRGLLLLDTKYEFGVDENGQVMVMDEVNTPDSSRLCDECEYERKYKQIEHEMHKQEKKYQSVSELLRERSDLKVKEFSKQYVRDILIDQGFDPEHMTKSTLTEEQVVECAYRYICVYERITGETFRFPSHVLSPAKRLLSNLAQLNFIKGCAVVIMAGSDSDAEHVNKIQTNLTALQIPSFVRICSAHKQCGKLESLLSYYNCSIEPLVIVAVAGGTDALSGSASFSSVFPVVSCPPDGINMSCLHNPPQSSNAFIMRPDNVAKFALQVFSTVNDEYREQCLASIATKVDKLNKADKQFSSKPSPTASATAKS